MLSCLEKCKELEVSCPNEECRMWLENEKYFNCLQQAIDNPTNTQSENYMDVRSVGEVLGISGARVHQIEKKALTKLFKKLKREKLL